ncbi:MULTISPECIES: Lrp/AsnC family transcriptional regulator [unclassified Arcicella]|uniref:Lrp/AsnC family transcriptional regulator n=1 Tax=unclassified Arcicella TaxID=2644986 RepID=UPI00285DA5D2|nr:MULTISPECIES: Lrp/AsnC family transcriptional regulator [unclassified Arcicella]MDR6562728.1 Lrp/AsnC family transcriptional regulator for asnA, asnC and gidA [Arcicella sp. BE51]MDR6812927.1 Lrp/AsnC family transcriptional regulator for asnA, asnC and gidA [Arcicella sp. BE140]MDR6824241.1 Lrp/AsnC family transcriptional regulator for asnA, asnC and gidA [Arcicella sp. BE139]
MSLTQPTNNNDVSFDLDELDFAILGQLQEDGRRSFTEMAENLKTSASTIRSRASKLIEDKTIQIVGRVNTARVGFHAYVHIKISVRPANLIESVAAQLQEFREVSFLAVTSGDFDIQVDVMCRDNNHLLEVINQRIPNIEGVFQTKTDMYIKILKYSQPDLGLLNKPKE